jgi:hypothetical protein
MDAFAQEFTTFIASLEGKTPSPRCVIDDTRVRDIAAEIHDTLTKHADNANEYAAYLNFAVGRYSLTLHEEYMATYIEVVKNVADTDDEDDDDDVDVVKLDPAFVDSHVQRLFTLLDLSIVLDTEYEGCESFAMHTFVTLLSYTYPIDVIITHFAPIFFKETNNNSNDENDHVHDHDDGASAAYRRRLLTKNYTLQGKVKPGSRLLVLYKQMVERIPLYDPANEKVVASFRNFISECFPIDDKLSQSLDWHSSNISTSGYLASFAEYAKVKKIRDDDVSRNKKRNLFVDYLKLTQYLTTVNAGELVQSMNKLTPAMGYGRGNGNGGNRGRNNSSSESAILLLEAISTNMKNSQSSLEKVQLHDKTANMFKWVLDEQTFNKQIQTYDMYWALKLQILIILNFLKQMRFDNWTTLCDSVASEYGKFRKPDSLVNPITSVEGKRRLNSWIEDIEKEFSSKFAKNEAVQHLLKVNENTFTKMKLKGFAHPTPDSLNEHARTESKKRKLEEFINNVDATTDETFMKKPKFAHSMGTPKLSKLWQTSTDQNMENFKSYVDVLDTVRDDMYFVRGTKEQSPDDATNNQKFARLAWKGLRSTRETGGWLRSVTRRCNEDGQCENGNTMF